MTIVTSEQITNAAAYSMTKKSASDVAEINDVLGKLEAAIVEMKKLNDTVMTFVWDNADDVGYALPQPEHAKMQQMVLYTPAEMPNGLNMRNWKGDKFPVSNWIAHTKNIHTHMTRLQAEFDTHKDNGRVVSWWVD